MDILQQVKAKLEEMKVKYNFERENEDNPNHSNGCGMFYSGFFTCLKEISFFLDTLEVKEVNVEKESELIANSIMIPVQANLYHTNVYDYEKRCYKHSELKDAARKGIELGLKAKGE